MFKVAYKRLHDVLKDICTVLYAHRQYLILVLAPGKECCTQPLGGFVQGHMVVTHTEVQRRGVLEPLEFLEQVRDTR
jgi:hypothetical protein